MEATSTGATVDDISPLYESYKAEWVEKVLGMSGENLGDKTLYGLIGEKFRKEDQKNELIQHMLSTVSKDAFDAVMGKEPSSKSYQRFIETLPEGFDPTAKRN